jgi:hypothetical protein
VHHRDRFAALAGLPTLVRDQEEGVTEQPPPTMVVDGLGEPHEPECEAAGLPAEAEQRPPSSARVGNAAHDFVAGGLKIRDS